MNGRASDFLQTFVLKKSCLFRDIFLKLKIPWNDKILTHIRMFKRANILHFRSCVSFFFISRKLLKLLKRDEKYVVR